MNSWFEEEAQTVHWDPHCSEGLNYIDGMSNRLPDWCISIYLLYKFYDIRKQK